MSKHEPLEALARSYDREDASQRGEPDPWKDAEDDAEWVSERLACAQVAEAAYLAAARSTVPEAGKAVVKSLVWEQPENKSIWYAVTPIYRYRIFAYEAGDFSWGAEGAPGVSGGTSSLEAAKAAAQADFEQRILSALASVAPSGAEPVAWRRERDGHLIDQPRLGYAPLYAVHKDGCEHSHSPVWLCNCPRPAPQEVPAEDVAKLVERLNDKHAEWQKQCDGWVDSARASGSDIADDIDHLRDTVYGEAAAALTSLSAERDHYAASELAGVEKARELFKRLDASEAEASALRRKLEGARKALSEALVAMKLAAALPGVSDEYDFAPAIDTATRTLLGASE
jgi:hypothetical protein